MAIPLIYKNDFSCGALKWQSFSIVTSQFPKAALQVDINCR